MSALTFDNEAARRLERSYMTPDIVRQREVTLGLLALKPGEHVIDIGSGPGFLAESMADAVGANGQVLGLDISNDLLESARRRNARPQLTYRHSDAVALDAPDAAFDVAVSTQVFEYVADRDRALREMHRVVKPGGRALVVATDWDGVVWRTADRPRMRAMLEAWEGHCADPRLPRTLGPRLRAAGFEVADVRGHAIVNTRLGADTYSIGIMNLMAAFARKREGSVAGQVDEWLAEQKELDARGEYFFSLTRFMFMATKAA
jgi:arsenite methyltransferase